MKHVVSVSGGKDSAATYCKALERGLPFRAVAADTGNEHPWTYEAIADLSRVTGGPEVEMVKADFAADIARKRAYVEANWFEDLVAGKPGRWERRARREISKANLAALRAWKAGVGPKPAPLPNDKPPMPADPFAVSVDPVPAEWGAWVWKSGRRPMGRDEAAEVVATALTFLVPTGNPYLDLCIWKGRFPSRTAQFCTEELKVHPINSQIVAPMLGAGETVVSWQGVRAAESIERSMLQPLQELNGGAGRLFAYRPILTWKVEEVFAYTARFGLKPNPLYAAGCSRVGCFPCINASKAELALVDRVFPDQVDRLEAWEERVSKCSKRSMATFFALSNDPLMVEAMTFDLMNGGDGSGLNVGGGIRQTVEWAKTARGGRQFEMFPSTESTVCSMHGACE